MAGQQGFGAEIEKAIAQLEGLDRSVVAALSEATLKGAQLLAETAEQAAPRDTGKLADSIEAKFYNAESESAVSVVVVGAWYARLVEYGTGIKRPKRKKAMNMGPLGFTKSASSVAARPFLRSSADMKAAEISAIIARSVDDQVIRTIRG